MELHQSITKALNGIDSQWYDKWVAVVFEQSPIMLQLARIQRNKIENKIVKAVQLIFLPNGQTDGNVSYQLLNQLMTKLNYLI
jgi:hypothetical protein